MNSINTFLKRGLKFFRRHVIDHPLYVIVYGFNFFRSKFVAKVNFYSESEIAKLIKSGRSIIRIGDGEVNLMLGYNNHYQIFDKKLKSFFRQLITDYTNGSKYILAIPRFVNMSNRELRTIEKFYVWMPLKTVFYLWFNKEVKYLDAHAFYYDGYFERVVGPNLINRNVLLITKEETINKQTKNPNLPFKFSGLAVPETQMLNKYDSILNSIDQFLNQHSKEKVTILLAAGPVGKMINRTFSDQGIQCIDIGKVAEVMHTGESIEHII